MNICKQISKNFRTTVCSIFDKGYRYGFNTQERDIELGKDIFTAEFWEYDSRLGRRWNLDPVVKFYLSNYSVLHNSPIIYIDIKGDDDFFDCNGNYLGSTTDGNQIRVIHTGVTLEVALTSIDVNTQTISKFDYSISVIGSENRLMLTKILGHYSICYGITLYGVENGDDDGVAFTSSKTGKVNISVNTLGKISNLLDDITNLNNTLVHEREHRDKVQTHESLFHPRAIMTQIKDPTWKNTTDDFKDGIIRSAISHYNDAANEKSKTKLGYQYTDEDIISEINEFNKILKESGSDIQLEYNSKNRTVTSNGAFKLKEHKITGKKRKKNN